MDTWGRTRSRAAHRNGPTPVPVAIDMHGRFSAIITTATASSTATSSRTTSSSARTGVWVRLRHRALGASQMTEAGRSSARRNTSPEHGERLSSALRSLLARVVRRDATGQVPFTGDTVEIAMTPRSPTTAVETPRVPHDLDAVVMRSLAKDEQRYDRPRRWTRIWHACGARRLRATGCDDAGPVGRRAATAATMIARPRVRPAHRRLPVAGPLRRRRHRAVARLAVAARAGAHHRRRARAVRSANQEQLDSNRPVAVPDVRLLQGPRCPADHAGRPESGRRAGTRRHGHVRA